MPRLSVSKGAKRDLVEIFLYIARDNAEAARSLLASFHDRFQLIAKQPGIGRKRVDLKSRYQSHAVGDYAIYYQYTKGLVRILRVVHGARDVKKLLS